MDDIKISLSVPATIYSFGETEKVLTQNQYVTHAKLKVFYIGKTPDRRVFTRQFSDQLLQSLPGTPVVAYYDEDKKDFVGHNPIQYVFGYVPETATITYEKEKDITFAVTDVLLFTGRDDNIGFIANKIIGKQHSLELDPTSVEFTVNRASNAVQSITFTKGKFIGLSVLGDKEKPAFAGSHFFRETGADVEAFVNSFTEFKREVEFYKSGGQEMNENEMTPVVPNEEMSEGSVQNVPTAQPASMEVVNPPMEEEEENCVVTEMLDPEQIKHEDPEIENPLEDPMVNPILDPIERTEGPYDSPKVTWTTPDQIVLEPDPNRIEPSLATEEVQPPFAGIEIEIEVEKEEPEEEDVETETEDMKAAGNFPKEGTTDVRKTKTETWESEKVAHATALDAAERQELNEYRKAAKISLIDSYLELSKETKEKYKANHEKFTLNELDKELAYEWAQSQRQIKNHGVRVFSMQIQAEQPKEGLAGLVEKYKDKK